MLVLEKRRRESLGKVERKRRKPFVQFKVVDEPPPLLHPDTNNELEFGMLHFMSSNWYASVGL